MPADRGYCLKLLVEPTDYVGIFFTENQFVVCPAAMTPYVTVLKSNHALCTRYKLKG